MKNPPLIFQALVIGSTSQFFQDANLVLGYYAVALLTTVVYNFTVYGGKSK